MLQSVCGHTIDLGLLFPSALIVFSAQNAQPDFVLSLRPRTAVIWLVAIVKNTSAIIIFAESELMKLSPTGISRAPNLSGLQRYHADRAECPRGDAAFFDGPLR